MRIILLDLNEQILSNLNLVSFKIDIQLRIITKEWEDIDFNFYEW